MCIIFLAYKIVPGWPLVLLANRDEFYDRAALPAAFWPDEPDIYAGRDLTAGGTWLGVTRSGRFAAVTNYREPDAAPGRVSRGNLVADFLRSDNSPKTFMEKVAGEADNYAGFNLITGVVGENTEICYYSNRGGRPRTLGSGIYGLSNHLLDSPWPKVARGKAQLVSLLRRPTFSTGELFGILSDRRTAPDEDLPSTGIPLERERSLSPIFIQTEGYGTRCSTVLTFDDESRWKFDEKVFV
jgi:uncharacterized protein with NRDE domain